MDTTKAQQTFRRMARVIHDQDNRATAHPIFYVEQVRERFETQDDQGDSVRHCWVDEDWEEIGDEALLARLAAWDDEICPDPDDHPAPKATKIFVFESWERVQPFFTEVGAQAYIDANAHNLTRPRIYVGSGYRNPEWQAIRQLLLDATSTTW